MSYPSQESLQKYAELIVRVGLNIHKGQRLLINNLTTRGVPLHVAPLVREVAKAAYKAGARYVEALWGDEELPYFLQCQKITLPDFNKSP